MKKHILIVLIVLFVLSCNSDDETNEMSYVVLPIESVQLPNEFVLNEEYDLDFTFVRPTVCHGYHSMLVKSEDETRTLAVQSVIYEHPNCEVLLVNNIASQSFKFKVLYGQIYVFRIFKGVDDLGEEVYEVIEVPVVN